MNSLLPFLPLIICIATLAYFIYKESAINFSLKIKKIKKKLTPKPIRERLKVMYKFETDKAVYIAYNTETIQGLDCVNIEIERQYKGNNEVILEKELFDDSWGTSNGQAFSSMIQYSKNHLENYIKNVGEFILDETKY